MTAPAYRLRAISDVFLPDGTVQHGVHSTVDQLKDQRLAVWDEAKKIIGPAQDRVFTPYEQVHWDLLMAQLDSLDRMIAERSR